MTNNEESGATVDDGGAASVNPLDRALADDYAVPADAAGALAMPVKILTLLAALFMFSIAALTVVDVTGRYIFNSPVQGGVELIEFMLGLLIFSALPLVTVKRAHIVVELFDGFMSKQFKLVREVIVLFISAGMIAFITERMWRTGLEMYEDQDISLTLELPTAPVLFALTLLSVISVAVQLYMLWKYVTVDFRAGVVPGFDYDKEGKDS